MKQGSALAGRKYTVITYGCQMNLCDSEKIRGILERNGCVPAASAEDADIIVFDTCCVRDTAERRALGNIGRTKALKERNRDLVVAVCGCMTQQEGFAEDLKRRYPYVDVVLGTNNIHRLADEIVRRVTGGRRVADVSDDGGFPEGTPSVRSGYPNAWVTITRGCDNFCSYCIVPYVRGRERSRDPDRILEECRSLVREGYGEITLLGQNVNSYGHDLRDGTDFSSLLRAVSGIEGKFRLRFLTSHPKDLTADVLDAMSASDKICRAIHLPLQAGSDAVLSAMNRRYTRERYLELIYMIREKLGPDTGITTDIMVGFPGETEEDFLDTLDMVRRIRFTSAFTFIYSVRKGTEAAGMRQLPYSVKRERIMRLIGLQDGITGEISESCVGKTFEVLVSGVPGEGLVEGRTDNGKLVTAPGDPSLVGRFVRIKINAAKNAALYGETI